MKPVWFLATTIGATILGLVVVIFAGWAPVLGLDLQGGIAITMSPVGDFDDESLSQASEIIRNRVDSLGVAEPEVSIQGQTVIIDLPGLKETGEVEEIVGQTAELQYRAVTGDLSPFDSASPLDLPVPFTVPPPLPDETIPAIPGADIIAGGPGSARPLQGADPGAAPAPSGPCNPTPDYEWADESEVVALGREENNQAACYQLGPVLETGEIVKGAVAQVNSQTGEWLVTVDFTGEGESAFFNKVVTPYRNQRVAIVLDHVVQSAPNISQDLGKTPSVEITGSFTRTEAETLARVLRFGSLPVELQIESVTSVSPTLGKDQLKAGVVAGVVGLLLVLIYMLLYYRVLGVIVWAGLLITGALTWVIIAVLGHFQGLALTLAGVTGLIVAVGVTVDSYVVYFERLKDEARGGASLSLALKRGFKSAWRTVLAADLVSLIGAVILFFLAVGSVRGFAFFLGVATFLDLVITFVFMQPLALLMAKREDLVTMKRFGIAAALDQAGFGKELLTTGVRQSSPGAQEMDAAGKKSGNAGDDENSGAIVSGRKRYGKKVAKFVAPSDGDDSK